MPRRNDTTSDVLNRVAAPAGLRRALGKWDLTAIGVNQVLGASVFAVPATVAAAAGAIPPAARAALADELRVLALPSVWLATLGSTAARPDELVLAAVVDTELLAVHTAVHDALAGRDVVKGGELSGLPGLLLRRNSVSGAVEVLRRPGTGIDLNPDLHAN